MHMQETSGRELATARTALGFTQIEVAAAAQRRREWPSRVEGKRSVPTTQARRYVEALAYCVGAQSE